jgi:hypothetical protein
MSAARTMTTTELADALETDPRTLRKFLRSSASPVAPVGKGKRYTLPATQTALRDFGKKFTAWNAAQEKARADRDAAATPETVDDSTPDAPEMVDDATDDADAEPTDADLEEITAELDEN